MKFALLLAALMVPVVAMAEPVDKNWLPWLGCWELVDDDRGEPLVGEADPTEGATVPKRGMVCLNPSPDGQGVTVTTAENGEAFLEETLVADGEKNPSAKGKCQGWQTSEWSGDGHRLFTNAELQCEDNRQLAISGLTMMVPSSTWVDIQIVESDAGRAVVLRRYRPAHADDVAEAGLTDLTAAIGRSRIKVTDPLSADDVAEAANRVAPEAVEAAVIEHEEGFELNADTLMQLGDAGVRPGLIDLMVAMSYPDRFIVKREQADDGMGVSLPSFYGAGTPYAFRHPYYMAPFASYYYYAPYDSRFIVRPVSTPAVRQGLVSRQGYAQVSTRPRSSRRARYRNGGSSGGYSSGESSSSSSGSVSSQGYSRGSGSTRSAKPRR